ARVHNGYHYPRSVLTALRSRVNFPRFVEEFRPAVDSSFQKLYAVARRTSKVTAEQFAESMRRIGAPIEPASEEVRKLFDPDTVEEVFRTQEYAFDSSELKRLMAARVRRAGVEVRLNTTVEHVRPLPGGAVGVRLNEHGTETELIAGMVFC